MSVKLKKNYLYGLLAPTSMGIRITPVANQPTYTGTSFHMFATSAESNAVSVSSFLGLPVKILTNFVIDSPIARFIKDDLSRRRITYEGPEVQQNGPWGYRHQLNIADSGFGARGPRVYNDRAGEVGRLLSRKDFDLDRIFRDEGVAIVHISGLIAALSSDTGSLCLEIARKAKENGTVVSFDLNYRESFWEGRKNELSTLFTQIAQLSDILIGNEEDFQLSLGIEGPETGGNDIASKIISFKEMIEKVKLSFPGTSVYTTTLREVISANRHMWGAILLTDDTWSIIEPREIGVLDRIGGGDGLVGGLLYGFLKGWDPKKCLQFGWATGALAVTLYTDYAQPADEQQIWSIWEGNARVKR
jgi:2-dehydro-3-deoxygluconokinase